MKEGEVAESFGGVGDCSVRSSKALPYQAPVPLLGPLTVGSLEGKPLNTSFNHGLAL